MWRRSDLWKKKFVLEAEYVNHIASDSLLNDTSTLARWIMTLYSMKAFYSHTIQIFWRDNKWCSPIKCKCCAFPGRWGNVGFIIPTFPSAARQASRTDSSVSPCFVLTYSSAKTDFLQTNRTAGAHHLLYGYPTVQH